MVSIRSSPSEEVLARWEADGGAAQRNLPATRRVDASAAVRFLGLSDVVRIRDGEAAFPLGILYPYTADLRRVGVVFDAFNRGVAGAGPALLASIATLHARIAFAPGRAGSTVADAYGAVEEAIRTNKRLAA